jgi:hypothetical protein
MMYVETQRMTALMYSGERARGQMDVLAGGPGSRASTDAAERMRTGPEGSEQSKRGEVASSRRKTCVGDQVVHRG